MTDSSSHILGFSQLGDTFLWKTPVNDAGSGTNGINIPATAALITLTYAPLGIQTTAFITAEVAAAASNLGVEISAPYQTPGLGLNMWTYGGTVPNNGQAYGDFHIRTNLLRQIQLVGSVAVTGSASAGLWIINRGWIDTRGK
jgi:hypothetical protein